MNAILFLKAHVEGYTRGGTYVRPYERRGEVMSFRSGASSPGIARGYIVANVPFGVSMIEMTPGSATWDMMAGYVARGGQVFVDTGAFTAHTKGRPLDWTATIARYRMLARQPGNGFHIVMPDVIGDQAASLALLARHRDVVRDVMASRHEALVPIQKGSLTPYRAWREAVRILGSDQFTASVPSNAAAFTPQDLANLFDGPEKPHRVHLLGIAGNKKRLAELVRVIRTRSPDTIITSDANRLRAQVGKKGNRPVTAARAEWAGIFRQMAQLLDDPQQRAAFEQDYERIMAPAVAAASIYAVERRGAAQRDQQADLFDGGHRDATRG